MAKEQADRLKQISVFQLKKHGYLSNHKSGTLTWNNPLSGQASISLESEVNGASGYIRLTYWQKQDSGEKKDYDYKVFVAASACYFGGLRYWLVCPIEKNGQRCGRRVGVLYKGGEYFGCRHCYELTYRSRNESGKGKAFGAIMDYLDFEDQGIKFKRHHYAGQYTKRYQRYLTKKHKGAAGIAMLQGRGDLAEKLGYFNKKPQTKNGKQ